MHHIIVSTLSYLGTSQKGKSHDMIQKNFSIFFIIIHHNIYWFQAIIIPTALNIKKGEFYSHSHVLLLLFSS